ncbi:cupin domain-containing protein [Halomonas urumqiensis]|uniref:Cupin domain-containing protein n=2 Tax=Halomonas urumqiensis TaxID=1684789 RepID=A0A2N7UQP5_9GAMM|nr:cupin domain-containing protein [Halomonas urumqiensis]PTB01926.1 cupin domain-containing protein [Halomonas urumqiensis]
MAKRAVHSTLEDAINLGPAPPGNLAIPIFSHGTMVTELYTPEGSDPQTPHSRDEIYIVAKGSGQFFDGQETLEIKEGSFIFVPAGTEYRFLNFTVGFSVWVVFYGPEGGES